MTFSDQWEKLLEAEISKGLTENELKSGVLDSENKETEVSASEQERVMSEFSERNPSPGRLHVSAEPLMEQMEEKQEKCDILSLGELMFQFNSPGVPHDETETQLKTEQTSSCEPAKNQEPAPQSCLNQEPAPQSCLNKEPAPQSCLNQEPAPQSCLNKEPAPQSCLNQEPAPQSSLTKPGPKKKRKQKPAKNLQGGLEEPKTPIKSFSTSERGKSPPIAPAQASLSSTETQQVKTIRNNLPSDERERSTPIVIRYSSPSDEQERSTPIKIRNNLPSDKRERSSPIKIRFSLPSDEQERSTPIKIRYSLPSEEQERSTPIKIRYSLPSDKRERSSPIKIRYSLPSDERERSPPIAIRYSLPSDERERSPPIAIRYSLPSDERERSPPIAIRYSFPSDAPFMPLHLIPDQGSTKIIQNREISSQWDTTHIHNLAWEVSRHILQEKYLFVAHPLVMKLCQQLEEQMLEWNVKESPNHNKKIACDIYRDLCSKKRNKLMNFSALVTEDESDTIITEIHNHLVRPKKSSKLYSFFQSIRHALCRHC
uniref:Uncharacterized protein n=1 Tax=Knipowitschia caucasica TaxID=637954 RepID=A0AAV2LAW6_KNICA